MIKNSSRVYSLAEINAMCMRELDEPFLDYFKRAPENIRRIVLAKIGIEGYRKYLESIIDETELEKQVDIKADVDSDSCKTSETNIAKEEAIAEDNEKRFEVFECHDSKYEQLYLSDIGIENKEETVVCDNVDAIDIGEEIKMSIFLPYADLQFGQRITVNELYFTITEDKCCQKHGRNFEQQQVVIKYGGGKNYGMMFNACYECKKLFMSRNQYDEYMPIWRDRQIVYHIMDV